MQDGRVEITRIPGMVRLPRQSATTSSHNVLNEKFSLFTRQNISRLCHTHLLLLNEQSESVVRIYCQISESLYHNIRRVAFDALQNFILGSFVDSGILQELIQSSDFAHSVAAILVAIRCLENCRAISIKTRWKAPFTPIHTRRVGENMLWRKVP